MSTSYYLQCQGCKLACDYGWQSHTSSRPGEREAAFIRKHQVTCFPGVFQVIAPEHWDDDVPYPKFETVEELRQWFYEWRKGKYPDSPDCWGIEIAGAGHQPQEASDAS